MQEISFKKFVLPEYYAKGTELCPLKRKICHEQKGNVGYVCEHFVDFECGDNPNKVICNYGIPIQLSLLNLFDL